ncbi:MAG: peptidylprolyl isomerase [Defluviitaleaceae bacterium]|nr:peptidylprolyl isomerase [Defluviitaleaceae bacterium]
MFKKRLLYMILFGFMVVLSACGAPSDIEGGAVTDFELPHPNLPAISIYIEGHGQLIAELYPAYAPMTVQHFMALVEAGFYDGLTFHRIIEGFMMQGGCPNGVGNGGSGTHIVGEFNDNGIENPLRHTRGVLSMARSADYNSASSQFFIMHGDAPHLDGGYAAFGRVIYGIEVIDAVIESVVPLDRNGTLDPDEHPVIREVRLINGL